MPNSSRWLIAVFMLLSVAAVGLCEGHLPRPWEDMQPDPPGLALSMAGLIACLALAAAGLLSGRRGRPAWVDRFARVGADRPLWVALGTGGLLGIAAAVPVAALGLEVGCQPAFPGSVGLVAALAGVVCWGGALANARGRHRGFAGFGAALNAVSLVYFAIVMGLIPAEPISARFPGLYYSQSACQLGPIALAVGEVALRGRRSHRGVLAGLGAATVVAVGYSATGGTIDWPTSRGLEALACLLAAQLGASAWAANSD